MKVTTTIISLTLGSLLLTSPLSAFAQTVTPTTTGRGANQSARLSTLNTLCTNAVNGRIASLNAASTRVNGLVKLSSTQKQQFSSEIATDISGLQQAQTQCTTDFNAGNLTALRTDYRNVFTQFRIYAEFLPQVHLLVASDTMDVTADKLSDLATKLQARIQVAGNPSNLTSLLSDMQAKIADARTQYGNVQSQITSLTPQAFDSNPSGTTSTLKNARSEIQTGASDLKAALADARQIIQALKTTTTPVPTQ